MQWLRFFVSTLILRYYKAQKFEVRTYESGESENHPSCCPNKDTLLLILCLVLRAVVILFFNKSCYDFA